MGWPDIGALTEAAKAVFAPTETPESAPAEPEAPAEKKPDTEAPTDAEAPKDEQKQPASPVPSDPASVVVGMVKEKGIKALLDALPADVREELRQTEYKTLHQTLSARDKAHAAELAARDQAFERKLEDLAERFETVGMDEETKQARKDARDLAALRAEKAQPPAPRGPVSAAEVTSMIAATPFIPAFWQQVEAIGLPKDPSNAQVRAFYKASLQATNKAATVEDAIDLMTHLAPTFKPKSEPKPADDLDKRVNELAEKRLDELLKKKGLLSADTGRPGASGGGGAQPNTLDGARQAMVEALTKANGR